MNRLIVEFIPMLDDKPDYYACWAEDVDHAKEQCENAYPYCRVTDIFGVIKSYPGE